MKKLIAVAAIGLLTLTGCAGTTGMIPATSDEYVQVYVVQMPDDTSVDCVTTHGMKAISCDWERRS